MAKAKATKTKTKAKNPLGRAPYDPADYLRTPKEVAMYLEAFFEDGVDHDALVHALGVVARARGGMSPIVDNLSPIVYSSKCFARKHSLRGSRSWRTVRRR